jgi:hypothetical protein
LLLNPRYTISLLFSRRAVSRYLFVGVIARSLASYRELIYPLLILKQSPLLLIASLLGGSQQVGELNLIPRFMDPELLMRVGKPEKYGSSFKQARLTNIRVGPNNNRLVLEYSPNTIHVLS